MSVGCLLAMVVLFLFVSPIFARLFWRDSRGQTDRLLTGKTRFNGKQQAALQRTDKVKQTKSNRQSQTDKVKH
jgi:hypothetical protein